MLPKAILTLGGLALALGSCGYFETQAPDPTPTASAYGDEESSAKQPNVILIVADDLGWAELGCYGQQKIKTPNIDRMASEGKRFTDFYAGAPVCAPSRSVLLTGQHMGHTYVRDNHEIGGWGDDDGEGQLPLPVGTETLGSMMQSAGYETACVGKWGLGGPDTIGEPNNQGFDHFFGYLCQRQAHNFYPTHMWEDGARVDYEGNVFKNLTGKHYSHDLMTEDALGWVGENSEKPFFLLLTYAIPHLALQVPEDSMEPYYGLWEDPPYDGKKGYLPHPTPRAAYAGMVSRMDRDVGSLMDLLAELDIDDNTIIMFTSDNGATYDIGGANSIFFESGGGLRGAKGSVYEGGLRVPLVVRWPDKIEAGSVSSTPAAFWDFMPTILDAAGAPASTTTDGVSLMPELLGTGELPAREYLYWEFPAYGSQQAIRMGDWKAVRRGLKKNPDAPIQLYNLKDDIAESKDVAAENPEVVAKAAKLMKEAHVPSAEFPLPGVDTQ
jgi:arylsulfatase A